MMEDWMLPLCLLDYLSMWSEKHFYQGNLEKGTFEN